MTMDTMTRPAWGRVPHDLQSRAPYLRMPFTREEYAARWQRVGAILDAFDIGVLVVVGRPGDSGFIRYLTNFESYVGDTVVVLNRKGEIALATNSLMRSEPMQSGVWMTCVEDVRPTGNRRYLPNAKPLEELTTDLIADYRTDGASIATCGSVPAALLRALHAAHPGVCFRDLGAEVADIMAVKSTAEIALLRRANVAADRVLDVVLRNLRAGVSENELAGLAYGEMMRLGAEGPSFPLALTAGERTGLKHASPTDYVARDGDMFFIDIGMVLDGYMTDNARSGVLGTPSDLQRAFLEACVEMTAAAATVAGPGVPQSALDDAAFAVASEYGFSQDYYFRAHGVGTALFLPPRFVPGDEKSLRPGELFSLEPMLVRHGFGTACVENTILITDDGAETLNQNTAQWWNPTG
ncbi:M24 family metallopeptidase [Pacificispira sp.]|uniref:M24 family metallopeptidase n=1 Tax=Pacificispira sp. TaxID=2888761 RepID=UPI003BA8B21D